MQIIQRPAAWCPCASTTVRHLQDAGLYLARPEPIALEGEVEYQLQLDGKPVGLFQVENSGREQGAWVGYGKLKPLPKPKPAPVQIAKIDEDDAQSDDAGPASQTSCREMQAEERFGL